VKTIQIKTVGGEVLFEHACEDNTVKNTLLEALKSYTNLTEVNWTGANLTEVNLTGADRTGAGLSGANLTSAGLTRADLTGAYLTSANLTSADLSGANLTSAYLSRANLTSAYLTRADLTGANLTGATIIDNETLLGCRPVIQIGPIGSRKDYLTAYSTNKGQRFDIGCQRQITREIFEKRITEQHDNNKCAQEYHAALAFIDAHHKIWGSL